ncbi:DUF5953 family protein [Cystobacter ferrugineus]|uniref:Immunity protein 52 domain-containing protein n=1 Tax=Cystobacter ferrugineus TaxID=83449 RepID=A0A1L9AUM0_9BACT|nr:DUF5953 family protein [Cystobacter ferrugineus]OJH33710.1 hypothetical protein BON30_47130 [Cystobacter ferrugineus]
MIAMSRSLSLIAYAPALARDDSRPLTIVHEMERTFPGLHLGWMISEEGQRIPLPDRDAFIARERKDGGFPLLRNGDDTFRVTVTGWERPAGSSPGGHAQFEVHADLPLDASGIAAAADVLEAVAEGARAFWGRMDPDGIAVTVSEQFRHPGEDPHVPPKGLPSLKLPWELPAPETPHHLGWLNYWSAAAARAIGFPDPARDAELLSRARRTATGGWVVRLTDAPLDLDNPAHLDALKRAYERFPEIGGRAAP